MVGIRIMNDFKEMLNYLYYLPIKPVCQTFVAGLNTLCIRPAIKISRQAFKKML